MCITTLIFDDITEPFMPGRVRRQFGTKQSIPRNPLVIGKRASRQGRHRDWRTVNADKFQHWKTRHDRMMPEIEEDTNNGLPSKEYRAWYNLVSHLLVHNVANLPKDILRSHNQEEEDVVPAHEPQYIMRPRSYEDQFASTFMLAEALTIGQKWNPEVYNRINNAFETLSKFVPEDMDDIEALMANL
ncbi:hypothetical protein AMTR_s00025p00041280 [Amborella trichopoda]|uniref:Aminotransferase-like plant mobile domain-containing protein n=1 Tax=Amborella trichopoda TaxID=13333 RepID=W1PXW8_AMBTC|nr:hypothetical protein AMTR_s00025p00041280 [Amborella trichopoda]